MVVGDAARTARRGCARSGAGQPGETGAVSTGSAGLADRAVGRGPYRWRVVDATTRPATTLDALLGDAEPFDLVGIDVQGAEAAVIRGGPRVVSRALAVCCEATFRPLYKDSGVFGDIDAEMRALGFKIVRLDDHPCAYGELIEGEAYSLADPKVIGDAATLVRYLLCCWFFGRRGWAERVLELVGPGLIGPALLASLRDQVALFPEFGTMVNRATMGADLRPYLGRPRVGA